MAIVCRNPTVRRLFEITRLDSTFDIHETREDALRTARAGYVATADGSSDAAP
jgi:anti-anti-sigma regulatory factor